MTEQVPEAWVPSQARRREDVERGEKAAELQRALRQLRCSGMAAGLEGRLLQAQAETLPPIDFLSTSVMSGPPGRVDRQNPRDPRRAALNVAVRCASIAGGDAK